MAVGIGMALVSWAGVTSSVVAGIVGGLVIGAVVGALGAAITGGSILQGALFGAIGGAVTGGLSGAMSAGTSTIQQGVSSGVQSTVGSGLQSVGPTLGEVGSVAAKQAVGEVAKTTFKEGAKTWFSTHGGEVIAKGVASVGKAMVDKSTAKSAQESNLALQEHKLQGELTLQERDAKNKLDQIAASKGGSGGSSGGAKSDALQMQREKIAADDKVRKETMADQRDAASLKTKLHGEGYTNTRAESQTAAIGGDVGVPVAPGTPAAPVAAIPEEEVQR